jgi:hypothetical protein
VFATLAPRFRQTCFSGSECAPTLGFWLESQRADHPGRMVFALVAKTLFVFATKVNTMRRVQDHPQGRKRGQARI